jgi:SMI1 / KNR4 family (SUKH-1)
LEVNYQSCGWQKMSELESAVKLLQLDSAKFSTYDAPQPIEELDRLEKTLLVKFPDDYREFLLYCDGGEFDNNTRLSFFDINKVYTFNIEKGDSLRQSIPGMILFADDYGNYVFYFDPENYLGRGRWAIYSVGLGSRSFEYSKYEAQNFTHLIQRALNEEGLTDGPWLKDEGYYPRPD